MSPVPTARTFFAPLALAALLCASLVLAGSSAAQTAPTPTARAASPAATRAAAQAAARAGRAPAITVNGRSVTKAQYETAVDQDVRQALARFGMAGAVNPRDPELAGLRTRLEAQTRERLTNWLVLLTAAQRARVRVSNDSVAAAWRETTADFPNDTALQAALAEAGKTRQSVQQDIRDNMTIDMFLRRRLGEVTATETEAREFFEANRARYATPEMVRARHILIMDTNARERITAIRARIVAGADFAQMAREHSQDGSAQNGGDLGPFTRGRMVPPFEEAAFSLPVGQVSQPVETQFGWHLIKVDEHRAATTPDYAEAREDVIRRVQQSKRSEKIQELIASLRRTARVRVHLPALPAEEPAPRPSPAGPAPTPAP